MIGVGLECKFCRICYRNYHWSTTIQFYSFSSISAVQKSHKYKPDVSLKPIRSELHILPSEGHWELKLNHYYPYNFRSLQGRISTIRLTTFFTLPPSTFNNFRSSLTLKLAYWRAVSGNINNIITDSIF